MSEKPLPSPASRTDRFWNGCNDEELILHECRSCGGCQLFPMDACRNCWSTDLSETVSSGTGEIVSYTVSHRPKDASFEDDVPYLIAIVELDEGPKVMSNLPEADPEELEVGGKVELTWEQRGEQKLYQFTPVE